MGYVYADITLKNALDVREHTLGSIQEPDIRQAKVHALVDTGTGMLVINEAVCEKLGLIVTGKKYATLANRTVERCKYTEPVEINWGNRSASIDAIVVEGTDEVLLGAIPLHMLDLIIDPARETLIGAHGDTPLIRI